MWKVMMKCLLIWILSDIKWMFIWLFNFGGLCILSLFFLLVIVDFVIVVKDVKFFLFLNDIFNYFLEGCVSMWIIYNEMMLLLK